MPQRIKTNVLNETYFFFAYLYFDCLIVVRTRNRRESPCVVSCVIT